MRVYSLYLSTTTGQQAITATIPTATTFTATISGTTLTVATSALSANLSAGLFFYTGTTLNWIVSGSGTAVGSTYTIAQSATYASATSFTSSVALSVSSTPVVLSTSYNVTINSTTYSIISLGASTGGTGYYLLSGSPSTSTTSQTYYVMNVSTNLPKYAPSNKTSLAQVKWIINWKEIFGNRIGECRVRAKLLSASTTAISWANNVGSLRATFASNTSNSTNGFNLAFVRPQSDYTAGTANTTYLDADTTMSNGSSIVIPNSNGEFTVSLVSAAESLMSNVPEYQLWLYFDVDDENPFTNSDSMTPIPPIFNPR